MKLDGKTILITGASSGLGREMALTLARRNNRLVITARREGRLRELQEEIERRGSACLVCPADATDRHAVQRVLDQAIAQFGPIDLAILNAGGGRALSMEDATIDDVLTMMRTNYDTFVNFLVPMIAHMKGRSAAIAYTGSPAGYFGLPKSGPYSAAKAAGRMLFDTCRIELAESGIRFHALYPGFTETEGLDVNDVPVRALVIAPERAAAEMLSAIERDQAHHMFPRRIKWLMGVARALPETVRRKALGLAKE